ncbi:MAG: ParB/RepB/Spo0J family partition protein [Pyrinomonadaceae bacterium]
MIEHKVEREVVMIPVGLIDPHPDNPRGPVIPDEVDGLADSVRSLGGFLQPLTVMPQGDRFTLVMGHRRFAAGKLLRLEEVPCIVAQFTPEQALDVMMVENIQRKDLSPLQEGRVYQRLLSNGMSFMQIVRKFEAYGISRVRVQSRAQLLDLDPRVQPYFDNGTLQIGLAVRLRTLPAAQQIDICTRAVEGNYSVARAVELIDGPEQSRSNRGPVTRRKYSYGRRAIPLPHGSQGTRSHCLATLADLGGSITPEDLAQLSPQACETCDEKDLPEICKSCPLTRLISLLVAQKEATNGKS